MFRTINVIFACLFFMFVATTAVYAQPTPEMWARNKGAIEEHTKKAISMANLTPEQFKQLEEHRQKTVNKMKEIMEQMLAKKKEIATEIQSDVVNKERVEQLNNEMKVLMLQMADHRMQSLLRMREIVSADQFRLIFGYFEKHMKNGMMKKGMMRNGMMKHGMMNHF